MRRKNPLNDLELHIDPKPLPKEEEIALSLFIKKLKDKAKRKKNHGRKRIAA